eukprot:3412418-Amphidinium_carterae.1
MESNALLRLCSSVLEVGGSKCNSSSSHPPAIACVVHWNRRLREQVQTHVPKTGMTALAANTTASAT